MPDDAVVLLVDAGQEAGHVDEGHQRDVEGIADLHEAGRLLRGPDVQHAGQDGGWLATIPVTWPSEPGQRADDVGRPVLVHLEDVAIVNDLR